MTHREDLQSVGGMNWRRLLLPLFVRKMSHSVSALSAASSLGAGRDLGKNLRVELFFSSADELTQRVAFLKSKGVVSYNLVSGPCMLRKGYWRRGSTPLPL